MSSETTIIRRGDSVRLDISTERYQLKGWDEAREDLGFNVGSPAKVNGLSLEQEHESDDGHVDHVVLDFDDLSALTRARRRLEQSSQERFEWGMSKEATRVQTFADNIPVPAEVAGYD